MKLNKIKIIMILLGVIGMMSGCQPNSQHNKQKDQLESTENHLDEKYDEKLCLEPKDLLKKMYQSKLSIFKASEFELKQYFDQQLVQYFLTQQKCINKKGQCDISFDYLSDSKSTVPYQYRIEETKNPFAYYVWINEGNTHRIVYEFDYDSVQIEKCPRIKNVMNSQGDSSGTQAINAVDTTDH